MRKGQGYLFGCQSFSKLFLKIISIVGEWIVPYNTPMSQHKNFASAPKPESGGKVWLHGFHAVRYALENPNRRVNRLLLTRESEGEFDYETYKGDKTLRPEITDRGTIEKMIGRDTVHQGIAAFCDPLPEVHIEDILASIGERSLIVALDQVTDPHNVGAILRSAAAFGCDALIMPEKNSPPLSGVLAKAACGGLDLVPVLRVTNLVRTLEQLKENEFWCLALDAEGQKTLAESKDFKRAVLVLGAEGEGLRRLTLENCDLQVRLPMTRDIGSLNVSNAAAIALYELRRE
jgi:23S rRNA (guanosine2251-2'-O)-methyltransferase